jgi:hypothetical protein
MSKLAFRVVTTQAIKHCIFVALASGKSKFLCVKTWPISVADYQV